MNESPNNVYEFGNFRLDTNKPALYHQNRLIKEIGDKPLRVLTVLLDSPGNVATHQEIIERVWTDNPHGINSVHIAQYIRKLRKVFADFEPDREFIQTAKGRGYIFVGDVAVRKKNDLLEALSETLTQQEPARQFTAPALPEIKAPAPRRTALKTFSLVLASIGVFLVVGWIWFAAGDDEKEIRRVVEDSQKYESLVLYNNPAAFDERKLREYWLPETDAAPDFDIKKIRAGVERLKKEQKYYGAESKCEQFEFQSIEIQKENNFAIVRTLEKWFLAEYASDGTLLKNKTVGPYFVTYFLRKTNGQWRIERSTTARAKPTPAA